MENKDLLKRTRSKPKEKFLIIHNDVVQNKTLSFKSKGFLCYILSLPDDWILHKSYVMKEFGIGRDALNSIFKELESHGYLIITDMITGEDGKFKGKNYLFYDEPVAIKGVDTDAGFPSTVNPSTGNQHLQSTYKDKVLIKQKDIVASDFEEVWALYPNKTNKAQAKKYYNAKIRIKTRPKIRAAVENYANQVKSGKIDKKYIMGGRSFFQDERWQEFTVTNTESLSIPIIPEAKGIPQERLDKLWEMSKMTESKFKQVCMAEKMYTNR